MCIRDRYEAAWLTAREREAETWLLRKSRDRHWWPTDASEWAVLKEVADFTAVAHVARLLVGGVNGPA
eukprot:13361167-Alexandrium_andersonii.AAC.1